jgi:hypothetical protein
MTHHERMQRESTLIAAIRKTLEEFAKVCADETDLVVLHQDALSSTLVSVEKKYVIAKNRSSLERKRQNPFDRRAGLSRGPGAIERTNCCRFLAILIF